MSIDTIDVALGSRSYPILIGQDILNELPGLIQRLGVRGKIGIITDTNVGPHYAAAVEAQVAAAGHAFVTATMPAGEANKRLTVIESLIGQCLEAGLDRSSAIIALGGGVVGDMAGFAAASFMRGIPYLQIPTTIVAQVDSSVGGKTGCNHPLGKNTIGAFHQPCGVLIDMTLLRTLPERELRAGLAEAIKHGIIADADLFAYMEANAGRILEGDLQALTVPVRRSCEIKSAIVAADELEHGVRANLNYGHTFGHAFEAVTAYREFLHGEAIALGMCAAGHLALDLGLVDAAFVARQRDCLAAYGLPVHWPALPVEASLEAMRHDKKVRAGTLKFIVSDGFGRVVHRTDVSPEAVRAALEALREPTAPAARTS